jgi:hypothetical protein
MIPETVMFVNYGWSSKTQDPKLLLLPTLPGNALIAEFDRDIEIIRREFSVTEFETCSTTQPAQPLCITWSLEDGGLLKYFYTMTPPGMPKKRRRKMNMTVNQAINKARLKVRQQNPEKNVRQAQIQTALEFLEVSGFLEAETLILAGLPGRWETLVREFMMGYNPHNSRSRS